MLFTTISPKAKSVIQTDMFTTEIIECDQLSVLLNPYGAGAQKIECEVILGNMISIDNVLQFNKVFSIFTSLTAKDISTWGQDDSTLLDIVASKLGAATSGYSTVEWGSF